MLSSYEQSEQENETLDYIEDHYPNYLKTAGMVDSPVTRIHYYSVALDELQKSREEPEADLELIDHLITTLKQRVNRERRRLAAEIKRQFRIRSTPKE